MNHQSHTRPERILELEGLRAIMAWAVVINHGMEMFACNNPSAFGRAFIGGGQAVQVFVILSGFVITYLLERKSPGKIEFLTGRFFRLWPLLTICLASTLLLEPLVRDNLAALSDVMPSADWRLHRLEVWDRRDAYYLPLSLTMVHAAAPEFILPHCDKYRLSPAWSIGLEWSFYLVAPFVVHAIQSRGKWLRCLFGILLACVFFGWLANWWNPSSLPVYAPFFALGIGSYYLYNHSSSLLEEVPVWMMISTCLIAGAIGGKPTLVWSIVVLGLIPGIRERSPLLMALWNFLGSKVLLFLGKISYSTYLAHWLIITLVQCAVLNKFSILPQDIGSSMITWFLFIAGTLLASVASYHLIERPSIQLGRLISRLVNRPAA